jgi:hypothetical protein
MNPLRNYRVFFRTTDSMDATGENATQLTGFPFIRGTRVNRCSFFHLPMRRIVAGLR